MKCTFKRSLAKPATNGPAQADATVGAGGPDWNRIILDWKCCLEKCSRGKTSTSQAVAGAQESWRAPMLTISTNLHTEMYQGHFAADASLNVATRLASFTCVSDFDVQKAVPLLKPRRAANAFELTRNSAGTKPPLIHGRLGSVMHCRRGRTRIPPPSGRLKCSRLFFWRVIFKVGAASYRKVPVTSAQSHITYSNMVWHLLLDSRPRARKAGWNWNTSRMIVNQRLLFPCPQSRLPPRGICDAALEERALPPSAPWICLIPPNRR